MRTGLRNIVIRMLSMMNFVIPKGRIISFSSLPDFSDNAASFFDYLATNNLGRYRMVWLLKWGYFYQTVNTIHQRYPDVKVTCVRKDSLFGIYCFLRSRYVFFTHGVYGDIRIPKRQTVVHLTHGMPIKDFTLVDASNPLTCTYVVATSELFRPILAKAFRVTEDRVLLLGSPRNDKVFQEHGVLARLGITRKNYQKIILWMPTYRVPVVHQARTNSDTRDSGIPFVTRQHLQAFNDFLSHHNLLCLFKPHPMSPINPDDFAKLSHIMLIRHDTLQRVYTDTHELLSETDILLTDYCSIFFDFLLLNRPIGFIHEDIEQYSRQLGFVLEPIEQWTPGASIRSIEELMDFLVEVTYHEDRYAAMRETVGKRAHRYLDGQSSQRVVEFFGLG